MRIGTEKQKRFKTLLQVGGMNSDVTEWLEHDSSILDSWKALRSEQRMFLYAVIVAIDIFVAHFSLLDLKEVKSKRDQAFIVGWKQLDFLFTNTCDLQNKREIINPERFLNSKTTTQRLPWNHMQISKLRTKYMLNLKHCTEEHCRMKGYLMSVRRVCRMQ